MTLVSEEPHKTGQLTISMNYDSTFAAGQNSVVYIVNNCGAEDYTIDMAGNSAVSCFFCLLRPSIQDLFSSLQIVLQYRGLLLEKLHALF